MTRWEKRAARKLVPFAALTAVVALASPAAAADSTTTVQASPSAATVGQPVHLTATVTCAGDPSGGQGVTFWDGAVILATVPVAPNGQVVYPQAPQYYLPSVGTHTITAAYNGNANCSASNAATTVVIFAAPVPPTPCPGEQYHGQLPYPHHPKDGHGRPWDAAQQQTLSQVSQDEHPLAGHAVSPHPCGQLL